MKKILLFFSAVLVSLAMQATVATQDIPLASFTPYVDKVEEVSTPQGSFNSTTLEFSEIIEWGGGQIWYGDDASALDATDFTHIGFDLASVAANDVRLTIEYTTADGNSSQSLDIKAGMKTKLLALNGRYIKKIEIKNWSAVANTSFTMSKCYFYKVIGNENTPISLFSGSRNLGNWTWDNRIVIDNTEFASAHDGDKIVITYTSGEGSQVCVRIAEGDGKPLSESGEYAGITQNQSVATDYEFIVRESDINELQEHGMYISGNAVIVTSVKLYTYEQQFMEEFVLNTGVELINWDQHWVHTSGLPTLSAGDELRVVVSAVDESGNYQVNFRHDDNGTNQIAVTGITATVPQVYSVTLTSEQATDINTGKLLIVGTGVTLSRFAIAKPRGIYHTLSHNEQAIDWTGMEFEASKFSDLSVGDVICANISEISGEFPKLFLEANWTSFSPKAEYYFNANHAMPMSVNYIVDADMLALIQSNGIRLRGEGCTVTQVYVQTATASTTRYTLHVTEAGMATLVLPFNVSSIPSGVQAYTLTNNGDATIWADPVNSIEADKPVLIIAAEGDYDFISQSGGNWDIAGKSWHSTDYRYNSLIGNYAPNRKAPQMHGSDYNYVLSNGADDVAFYRVTSSDIDMAPYRAYLSCSYPGGGGAGAPMRISFRQHTPTGAETLTTDGQEPSALKVLRDGKLFIIRNGVTYSVNGQIVK